MQEETLTQAIANITGNLSMHGDALEKLVDDLEAKIEGNKPKVEDKSPLCGWSMDNLTGVYNNLRERESRIEKLIQRLNDLVSEL